MTVLSSVLSSYSGGGARLYIARVTTSSRTRWAGYVASTIIRNGLMQTREVKRALGKLWRRWVNNIKAGVKAIRW
jgi:hypothetical protein